MYTNVTSRTTKGFFILGLIYAFPTDVPASWSRAKPFLKQRATRTTAYDMDTPALISFHVLFDSLSDTCRPNYFFMCKEPKYIGLFCCRQSPVRIASIAPGAVLAPQILGPCRGWSSKSHLYRRDIQCLLYLPTPTVWLY